MTSITVAPSSPVAQLRALTADTWNQAIDHQFVRELFTGTITDDHLASYLVQDYQFFESFLSMLGACVAHSDTLDAKLRFSRQLGMLTADEDGYFQHAFTQLGVTETAWQHPVLTRTTERFRELMEAATTSANYAHVLVLLVIAEWLYLDWGERTDLGMPTRAVHAGWIDLHKGADFRAWVQFLVDELGRVFPAGDPRAAARLEAVWREAVELELAFFAEVYAS